MTRLASGTRALMVVLPYQTPTAGGVAAALPCRHLVPTELGRSRYRTWKVIGTSIQTWTLWSRFRAGENLKTSATSRAASSNCT